MLTAVYPGSFDPLTNGHLDIIVRASRCFDRVFVVVFENSEKSALFTSAERKAMIEDVCSDLPNVEVDTSSGLLVEYAKAKGAGVIVKGLRAVSDFDYEFKMAIMNKKMRPEIETMFMMTSQEHLYLSSSLVKEVSSYGGSIKDLVPPQIEKIVSERIGGRKASKSN
ncbi:MAG: pantetheine-phosphate adenylyltransferase [Bacillota bacterium]